MQYSGPGADLLRNQTPRGFSLIEVLIALLILTIGILGVAGLQMVSLQQNRNTMLRDQALHAGNAILERMRANPDTAYAPVTLAAMPGASKNCINTNCNPVEMARFDIAQWKCQINPFHDDGTILPVCNSFQISHASLPEGKGAIAISAGVHTVTVQWARDRKGNTSSLALSTQTGQVSETH